MRHRPSESEISGLSHMSQAERLSYFLSRSMEVEEIWSLGNASGWELQERDGRSFVYVWPYIDLARMNLADDSGSSSPQATSLDHFFQNILPIMIQQKIDLDVLSLPGCAGRLIAASDLYTMMESLLESGEYYIEG